MNDMYIVMLIALALLAVADLVVGVANDAVKFPCLKYMRMMTVFPRWEIILIALKPLKLLLGF